MSVARRLRRKEQRETKKLFEKLRVETLKKMATLSDEDKLVLEQEHKEFIKRMENGM